MIQNPFHTHIHSLEELADGISAELHRPVTIEDVHHRLLSHSSHQSTDAARTSTIIERRVPERVINHLWRTGVIPTLMAAKGPIYIPEIKEIGLGNRLVISIWHKEQVLGFIWVLEGENTFTEKDKQFMKYAAESAKNFLLKRKIKMNIKEENHQEVFWKMLTGQFHSNELIIEKFRALRIMQPSFYVIAIFQFSQAITDDEERKLGYVLNAMQGCEVLLYTIDQEQLIILAALNEKELSLEILYQFSERLISKIKERLGVDSVIQGISSVQSDLVHIGTAYKEASTVLSMKKTFAVEIDHIHSYQNLGFYRYLDILLANLKAEELESYHLKKLHEYDQKYNTNLVETLEEYLIKDCNIHDAARSLNIHSNTLNYRLKRISDIGEIDLKDVTQKTTLFLVLKLTRHSGNPNSEFLEIGNNAS
nr:helix-turn-helix domain-containing protein [uncultured Bacillus sp.]